MLYPRQTLPTPGVFPLEVQPYGNLAAQAVQRFEKYEDLAGHKVGPGRGGHRGGEGMRCPPGFDPHKP